MGDNTHVPTKENCEALDKALKAKGMKPMETMFYWGQDTLFGKPISPWIYRSQDSEDIEYLAPAPLVSELGEVLPYTALGAYLNIFKGHPSENDWRVGYGLEKTVVAPTEADARCLCLIYLINNDLIS